MVSECDRKAVPNDWASMPNGKLAKLTVKLTVKEIYRSGLMTGSVTWL